MISGLSKFTSVRHIVSVSTLDLVADEENLRKLNEKGLQATEKRSRRKSRDKSPGRKKRVTSLLEEGDYPSLRIDNPSITSDFTLKRDLYEDGYGLKFCNQRMYPNIPRSFVNVGLPRVSTFRLLTSFSTHQPYCQ